MKNFIKFFKSLFVLIVVLLLVETAKGQGLGLSATLSNYNGSNNSCATSSDGTITLTVSLGYPPYQFAWSNGANTQNLSGLAAGTYSCYVQDSVLTLDSITVTLNAPPPLNAFFTASGGITNVTCNGGNNGAASVTVVGGTSGYAFAWSNGATTQTNSNLMAGWYYVTVTDANGCQTSASVQITEPTALNVNLYAGVASAPYNIPCYGGSITIYSFVNGATPSYTYLWGDGSTKDHFDGAVANTYYYVTVTDANGCTKADSISLTQYPAIADNLTSPVNSYGYNVSCNNGTGGADGEINLLVSGGNSPYFASLSNGMPMPNDTAKNLQAGFYTVTIKDGNNCIKTDTITLTTPPPMGTLNDSVVLYLNNANCSCDTCVDGIVVAQPTLGTPNYHYLWTSSPATFTNAGDTNQTITGCSPMPVNYYLQVTDAGGCHANKGPILLMPAKSDDWRVTGNHGNAGWLGTIDSTDLVIKTNDSIRMRISANGLLTKQGVSVFDTIRVGRVMTNSPDSIIRLGDSTIYIYPYNMIGFSTGLADIPLLNSTILAGSGNSSTYNGLIIGNPISFPYTPWWNHNITLYMSVPPPASAPNSIAIGFSVNNAVGSNSSNTATNSIIMGEFITNTIPNSMMIGFGGSQPTVFVSPSNSSGSGNVGIGMSNPQYKLDITGTVHACEVLVDNSNNCDFVFEDSYKLMPLNNLDSLIRRNKHLPNIPSAEEMVRNGVGLGEMNGKLLQKIEEQTLYIIDLQKQIYDQNKKIEEIQKQLIKK